MVAAQFGHHLNADKDPVEGPRKILSSCRTHLASNQFVIGLKYWLIETLTLVSNPRPKDTEHKQEKSV